ncbi:transposase family protein, partial [Actinomyces ruminicola]|uniref:transposase family protein n=1 Tax=Actinomyces ruminicola TaxID=332524 RepID=UPI001C9D3BBA
MLGLEGHSGAVLGQVPQDRFECAGRLHPSGAIAWVSDPLPGSVHDAAALRASGLLDVPPQDLPGGQAPPTHIGDKGYTGLGMITPIKKLPGPPLHE